ncbi:hypothetical protein RHECNPAF_750072 [Rhizobium etli CNPAF512]|nr:hypothetical protein RHECNPAF_750072 [Rhizobium etli CNPAF512]
MGKRARDMRRNQRPENDLKDIRVQRTRGIDAKIIGGDARQRHGEDQDIETGMRKLRRKTEDRRLLRDFDRHAVDETQPESHHGEQQDSDTDIGMDVGRCNLLRRRHLASAHEPMPYVHAVRKQQIEEDQKRHRPMKRALAEAVILGGRLLHFLTFVTCRCLRCAKIKTAACLAASG